MFNFHPDNAPSPGIYAVTIFPLLSRTLAVFLSPEFGFFGLIVRTLMQTPFISGLRVNAGDSFLRAGCGLRHPRITCIRVAWVGRVVEKCRVTAACGERT